MPTAGFGEPVVVDEFGGRNLTSVANGEANFFDFHQSVRPDWNSSREVSQEHLWSVTGHWPVLFSSINKFLFIFSNEETINRAFSTSPIPGALTTSKIIFPFHYFW